ncbi:MAG: DUF402 domain-containing protein [Clostridiales bacterium]|nr:DUF402 domain-containing protein [Clostridiales bacterium]
MNPPVLLRRRFIPDETTVLADDKILALDNDLIITLWRTLKPRKDIAGGCSIYFLKKGFKVSRCLDANGVCVYTYCDIFECEYDGGSNTYSFNDLLIDVLVYPDGFVKVVDLGELSQALSLGLITVDMAKLALERADSLLDIIYGGRLAELTKYFQDGEQYG